MPFDVSELKEQNVELLRLLSLHLPDMLWVKDLDGNYLYVNKAICDGLLMAKDIYEPLGKNDVFFAKRERELHKERPDWHTFGELCFNSDQMVIENNKAMRFEEYGNIKGEMLYLEVYKAPFYDKNGNVIGTVGTGRDITDLKKTQLRLEESLKQQQLQQEQLEFQATHDVLTNLPNRILFHDRLERSIEKAKRYGTKFGVLFIDLDNFKEINDSLGHTVGDNVLVEAARRIEKVMYRTDTLSRFGGDEFCILLDNIQAFFEVEKVIAKYQEAIQKAFVIEHNTFHVAMSVGVAVYPEDGRSVDELLRNADAAMYKAKHDGRNTYCFYDEQMTKNAYDRVQLENELRKAFEADHFEVFYQPQINSQTSELIGLEALVRWRHPQKGILAPNHFIPLAEQNGMIIALDRIVMQKAFAQYTQWKNRGLIHCKLAVNVSMKQIEKDDFLVFLRYMCDSEKIEYSNIVLEITETQIMHEPELSIMKLQEISNLGISLAIDDFGTGYSSLAYLKRLPIQKLKIDKSFIDYLPEDNEDAVISKAIISLAKNLNLSVIAEGVETLMQKEFLLENGCTSIQGYLYSKPLCHTDMEHFLSVRHG